jgi:small subunit ribosomal protein S20
VANLAQAKKRNKQNETRHQRNRARKSTLKSHTRAVLDSIRDGDLEKAKNQFVTLTKKLDQVAAKGTLHKKTVARRKSRLAKRLNAAATAS